MTERMTRREAIARGLIRYYTGKPCKRGHLSERYIWGACLECKGVGAPRTKTPADVLHARRLERLRRWKKAHRELVNAQHRRRWARRR